MITGLILFYFNSQSCFHLLNVYLRSVTSSMKCMDLMPRSSGNCPTRVCLSITHLLFPLLLRIRIHQPRSNQRGTRQLLMEARGPKNLLIQMHPSKRGELSAWPIPLLLLPATLTWLRLYKPSCPCFIKQTPICKLWKMPTHLLPSCVPSVQMPLQTASFSNPHSVLWLHHTLASAILFPSLARPYIPQAANISDRLHTKIVKGKDINLLRLLLLSPECDKKLASGNNVTAVLKSSNPHLFRDMSIGQFLAAFSWSWCHMHCLPRYTSRIRCICGPN